MKEKSIKYSYLKKKWVVWGEANKAVPHARVADEARSRWTPPADGWTKLNVDGSFCASTGTAGAGMVLQDSLGKIIFSSCRELRACAEPLEAELLSCIEDLNLALQWMQLPIEVETGCSVALKMITIVDRDLSRYSMLVDQIRRLMSEGRVVKLADICREQNSISHYLASFGRTECRTVVWLGSGPGNVPDLCKTDYALE